MALMNHRGKGLAALAILVALVAGFYWKLVLTDEFVWFDHPDMVYLELPRLEFQAREFQQRGRFPLWDPHIWMGQPLIGQTQPGPLNPLNLLMMLWPLDEAGYLRVRVLNGYFVAMHMIAALGFYWLARELKRSRAAAILGACAFSFSGFVGSAPWLDVLSGALWTPLIVLFFLRAARGIRAAESAAWSGFFLGLAWLSGHHEVPLLVALALGVAWAAVILTRRRRPPQPGRWAMAGRAGLTFAIAGLVAAVQMWPTIEFGRLAKRWGPVPGPVGWADHVSYFSSAMYSFTPRGMLGIVFPDQGTAGDSSVFAGVVVSALALAGLIAGWRHPVSKWLAAVAAVALIYALGEYTPVHGLISAMIPPLNKARVPVRALHLTNFAMAVLAAYGVDRVLRWGNTPSTATAFWNLRIARVLATAGGCVLVAALAWKVEASEALLLSAWVSIAWLGLTMAWMRGHAGRTVVCAAMAVLMMSELNLALTRTWKSRFGEKGHPFARRLEAHRDLVDFLRREPGPVRVRVNDQDVPENFGDLHSIDMYEGYTAGVTVNLLHYGRHMPAPQRLYGVTHYMARKPDRPELIDSYEATDGVKVFRVPNSLGRVRTVHRVEKVAREEGLAARIDDPAFDPGQTVLLVGPDAPALEPCAGDEVELIAYAPNRVRIQAGMRCRGMLVLADTHYPGWEGLVDGRPVRIWAAYGSVRGVVLEGGRHEVEFRFRPRSVYGGAVLTGLGVVGVLLITLVGRWRIR